MEAQISRKDMTRITTELAADSMTNSLLARVIDPEAENDPLAQAPMV